MRVLHTVEFYHPSVGGTQYVVRQLSERLAALGHEVTVATSSDSERRSDEIDGLRIVEFDIVGSSATGLSGDLQAYRRFLREYDGDVIVNFGAQQWATDLMLDLLPELRPAKVIVPTGFSGLRVPEFRAYYRRMPEHLAHYDACVLLSEITQDARFVRKSADVGCIVIPNGADEREFSAQPEIDIRARLGIPAGHFLVLHVGTHTGVKGHSEAIEMFSRARISDSTLLIVGNGAGGCAESCGRSAERFALPGKRLLVTPLTRGETVAALHAADLFLFPSNIECSPLVLFECIASRTPFLASDAGNAREIIETTDAGWLLPTRIDRRGYSHVHVRAGSKMLERAFRDRAGLRLAGERGNDIWRKRFTWERIARDYESLYDRLLTAP